MNTWHSDDLPESHRIGGSGRVLVGLRGVALGGLVLGGLAVLLLLRLVERPLFGQGRPWTPVVTQVVCRNAFRVMGIGYRTEGRPMTGPGAVVANHSSWLDIFALNAAKRIYFVSKAEVAGWPGIGWLARATGTVFIARDRRAARGQVETFRARLGLGHKLLFFPEGTSTDGRRVLPFKPTLFEAFFDPAYRDTLRVQPVSVIYRAPPETDPRIYGWWGTMDFGPHLLATLAQRPQGRVIVKYHAPLAVADFADRKALAGALERTVRNGLQEAGVTGA
ncbi:lysophospholipid acyltransferase family protein [Salibaculum sp.]|uniref:lysophospholipid acyltransferase family protein n=1 Tax=Salibaculum sp. TaxID=2855480 RepID=UPI002B474C4B|nr:lysophospholipid acyltransferase family protein [Salibaculum sp.]HKL70801.1 lysophospholipid acyltransferase family protein [Salibaculum sp.]